MGTKFWPELMSGLEQLFNNKENYDVVIQTGDNKIYVHSIILCCQSTYFRSNLRKKKNGKYFYKKFTTPVKTLENIFRFLYCGKIELNVEEDSVSDIFNLLKTANEFELHSLVLHIQEFLIDSNQKEFIKDNALEFFDNTFQNENFEVIRNYCLEIICESPELLFENDIFLTLSSQMVEFILKQEKITLDEIEIWDYLIKWAYAQNPEIDQDPEDWTNDEIEVMKQTTQRLIPLIRFQDISSVIYHKKVHPYIALLPRKLLNEIIQFYLVPNTKIVSTLPSRKSKYSVTVTESQIFAIFASWIEKKNSSYYNTQNIPYKFNLIYRASRDGISGAAFHNLCDNKGPTIVIAKVANSEQIIGGYNPLDWRPILNKDNNYYKLTNDSFIFSFADRNNPQTAIVSYPKENHQYFSIYSHSSYGPIFGGGHDLLCKNNGTWTCNPQHTYSMDLPHNFKANNYEVFQVIIKY